MTECFPLRLADLQDEVYRLLGRCVIQCQHYEMRLKELLHASDIRIEKRAGSDNQLTYGVGTERDTLGLLIKKLLEIYLIPKTHQSDEYAHTEASIKAQARFQVAMSPEDHRELQHDFAAFVALRNHLVHHFIADKDLTSFEDCRSAQQELSDALKVIEQQKVLLSHLIEARNDSAKMMSEHLSQGGMEGLLR